MRFTDNIVSKVGSDKLLHLCVSGWIISLLQNTGMIPMTIATILLISLGIIKERKLDREADWNDFYFSLLGIVISWLFYIMS